MPKKLLVLFLVLIVRCSGNNSVQKNIVFIVADDLGWNDVSFHGSDQILTPNIDLLAYTGVALDRYYSHAICTPSRAALLTGKYAHVLGMQGYPLTNGEDRGLPDTENILPQYLKELGYDTHLVGKWHQGQSRTKFLPTSRGFDSFFGHAGGFIDYYEYTAEETWTFGKVPGFGLYKNTTPAWDVEGYITDVYTKEAKTIIQSQDTSRPLFLMVSHNAPHGGNDGAILQAPPQDVRAMRHVESPERRIYSAMVKKLDDGVGEIVESLQIKGILNDTIIVFVSDNGGMTSGNSINYASNWPLRGIKMSPYEGGIRVVGLIWTADYNSHNHLWKGYMHVSDWVPTLTKAIGADVPKKLQGIDQWDNIMFNKESRRHELFEIDDLTGYAAIISGDFKLVTGNVTTDYSGHQGKDLRGIIGTPPDYNQAIRQSKTYNILNELGKPFEMDKINIRNEMRLRCDEISNESQICMSSNDKYCLFNIKDDPCELNDLSAVNIDKVKQLKDRLDQELKLVIPRTAIVRDVRALPSLFEYAWTPWADSLP